MISANRLAGPAAHHAVQGVTLGGKQYHRAEAEAKLVETQQRKIDELEQRLSRLESLIGSPVKAAQENMPNVVAQGGAQ